MSEGLILDLIRESVWITFLMAAPVLLTALAVGVTIGLVQALTSIQEMTLTFAPKLLAIAIVFWISLGATGRFLLDFWNGRVLSLIVNG